MSREVRSRLSYANLTSTLCLVLLLGGGVAYAASQLGKNSVGTRQLRKGAVTGKKIKNGSITAAKVRRDSLGGAQIKEASLGVVPGARHADTAADAATLAGAPPSAFLSSSRVKFGTGFATAVPSQSLIDLSELGITVSTDGDADTEPNVAVSLPTGSNWYVFDENSGTQMFSLPKGGQILLTAQPEVFGVRSSYLSVLVWRTEPTAAGMYLRCVFDTHGFTSARPLACWALRV